MKSWPATKARRVLAALIRIGWQIKRTAGSHRTLARPTWPDFIFGTTAKGTLSGTARRGAEAPG